jgi:hypothetical protein
MLAMLMQLQSAPKSDGAGRRLWHATLSHVTFIHYKRTALRERLNRDYEQHITLSLSVILQLHIKQQI